MINDYWEGGKSLKSLRDRVVVKLDETEETTKAGLTFIPSRLVNGYRRSTTSF